MAEGAPQNGHLVTSLELSENPSDLWREAQVVFDAFSAALAAKKPCEEELARVKQEAAAAGLTQRELRLLHFLAIPPVEQAGPADGRPNAQDY